MRMRLIRKSIKNIWQIIVIVWLVFAYQLMLNMVPDEVKLIDGDLSKLDISMPVTFECRDSGRANFLPKGKHMFIFSAICAKI